MSAMGSLVDCMGVCWCLPARGMQPIDLVSRCPLHVLLRGILLHVDLMFMLYCLPMARVVCAFGALLRAQS